MQNVPYLLVVGGRKLAAGTVAVCLLNGEYLDAMPVEELVVALREKIIRLKT